MENNSFEKFLLTQNLIDKSSSIGVLSGRSSLLMINMLYAEYIIDENIIETLDDYNKTLVDEIIHEISKFKSFTTCNEFSYCEGITGALFTFEILRKLELLDDNTNLLADFDDYLFNYCSLLIEQNFWDPLYGLIGIGIHFAHRKYNRGLQLILDYLDRTKIQCFTDAYCWESNNETYGNVIDTGLAHGNSGIMSFLMLCLEIQDFKHQSKKLSLGLLKFFDYINSSVDSLYKWKYFYKKEDLLNIRDLDVSDSKLAWCYGDLIITYNILKASRLLNQAVFHSKYYSHMVNLSLIRLPEVANISDKFVCHGTTGVAYIFFQLSKLNKDLYFNNAFEYWRKVDLKPLNKETTEEAKKISILSGKLGELFTSFAMDNHALLQKKGLNILPNILLL